jgi:hypothetical protein
LSRIGNRFWVPKRVYEVRVDMFSVEGRVSIRRYADLGWAVR